jgi:hypothetical protein
MHREGVREKLGSYRDISLGILKKITMNQSVNI